MARIYFGKTEELKCFEAIPRFDIPTADGTTDVCFAAKITTQSLFLPWRIYQDGYVLTPDNDKYYNLSKENIEYYQSRGSIPNVLPEYKISTFDFIFGNLLWLVLIAIIGQVGYGIYKDSKSEKTTGEINKE